ncbi:MAG TPA: SdrD B-like domain-containing protein [Actinospica sp.]|jgi:hypothetical protein|nr:SdrD B-like domain-containing protein [Actinospica sp.]
MRRSPLSPAVRRSAIGLCIALAVEAGLAAPTAHAGAGDGSLTVRVVHSIAGDGGYDPAVDVGIPSASVQVSDASGHTVSGVTGPGGTLAVNLSGLGGGHYRVRVAPPTGSSLVAAPAGKGLSALTDYVDVSGGKAANPVMGLWNPDTYCQADPTLVSCNLQRGDQTGGLGLFSFQGVSGTSATAPGGPYKQLSKVGDQGAVFGIGTDRSGNVFAGTYVKRHTNYGPAGNVNAIYRYNVNNPGGGVSTFVTLPGALTNHVEFDIFDPGNKIPYVDDNDVYNDVGRKGIGGVAVSGDGSTLYAVDLNDSSLYTVPINGSGSSVMPGVATGVPIPRPGANCNGDWHPFGLGVSSSTVYVGGVCGAENTTLNPLTPWGDPSQEYAFVYRYFNGVFTQILDFPLNFPRGCAYQFKTPTVGNCQPQLGGTLSAYWEAWNQRTATPGKFGFSSAPQPMLTSIDVTDDGGLDLGFRDRYPDMEGTYLHRHNSRTDQVVAIGAGDLLRACVVNGAYQLESDGSCGATTGSGVADGLGPNGGEFFTSIWNGSDAVHDHTATGGTTYLPGFDDEWSTRYDPFSDPWHKGVSLYGGTGSPSQGIEIGGSELNQNIAFGKGNSLADIEKLCNAAPVQIGDRVWYDADHDGIQGPAEPGVAGVKVTLKDSGGNTVATTTTDANGLYYFGTSDGVKTNTTYTLAFDYSGATGLPGGVTASELSWTKQNAGSDRCIDSDVNTSGVATVAVGKAGDVNHCVDAGLAGPQDSIGDRVWYDTNRNGIQDAGEPGIGGVKATLENAAGTALATTTTDSTGHYLFDGLPDGTYRVCFDKSTLPAQYADGSFTRQDAAGGNGTDSAADASGCTGLVTLGPDHRTDLTRDAGITTPPNSIGDRVWLDEHRDGIQDAGDPGVGGVTVTLVDKTGARIETTTTDSAGRYLFDGLPDGTYRVCFDKSTFPLGDGLTVPDVHGGDGTDSAADRQTGCTGPVTLGPGHRVNLTRDAGLVKVPVTPPAPVGKLARTGLDLPLTGLLLLALGTLASAAYLLLRRRREA